MAGSSDKASSSSSGWSDEEGDEYLAKALASDEYLQGSRATTSSSSAPTLPQLEDATVVTDATINSSSSNDDKRGTILIHHPLCELHDIPDHPERPGRVRAIMNSLTRNFPGIITMLAPEATVEQVLRFHDQPHVDKILRFCSASEKRGKAAAGIGGKRGSPLGRRQQYDSIVRIDSDTAVMPLSRGAIFRAAGAACFAVDEVMSGAAVNAFCCVRPPGHHAEPDKAMGFCFFNNAPIGALHAKVVHGAERVAVVDIDVHHGNGTQAFFRSDPTAFYASTHQGPHFYPGTGFDDITGVQGNIVNISMENGEGSGEFRKAYSETILPALEAFRPGLIVISAGFDAHADDPLAGIALDAEDYGWVTREICAVATRVCAGRVVSILEGGYNLQAISDSAVAHVRALRQAAAATSPGASPTARKSIAAATAAASDTLSTEISTATATAAAAEDQEKGDKNASTDTLSPPSSPCKRAEKDHGAKVAPRSDDDTNKNNGKITENGDKDASRNNDKGKDESNSNGGATPPAGGVSKVGGSGGVTTEGAASPAPAVGVVAALTEGTPTTGSEWDGFGEVSGGVGAEEQEDIDLLLAQLSIEDGDGSRQEDGAGEAGEGVEKDAPL